MLIVVMGVCGSGKTAVAEALATQLGVPFLEGDSFHGQTNVAKMRSGVALTDADREPWLQTLAATLRAHTESGAVLACSALRRRYRDILRAGGSFALVHLSGKRQTIAGRMSGRSDHYMPASLLDSQLAILEPPGEDERHLMVDIDRPVEQIVDRVERWLEKQSSHRLD